MERREGDSMPSTSKEFSNAQNTRSYAERSVYYDCKYLPIVSEINFSQRPKKNRQKQSIMRSITSIADLLESIARTYLFSSP